MIKQIMWMIFHKDGRMQIDTLSFYRKDAIRLHLLGQETYTWSDVRKFGWEVRKVEVTIKTI